MTTVEQASIGHKSVGPVVVIVGLPGVGKSTIGRRAASRLGWDFLDLDASIEAGEGRSIRDIFAVEGEEAFRTIEAQALERGLDSERPILIATGGGVVLRQENRERLKRAAAVVWMTASVADLEARLKPRSGTARGHRPLLDGDLTETLQRLADQREPLYRDVATEVLATAGRTFEDVVEDLIGRIQGAIPGEHVSTHRAPASHVSSSVPPGEED